MGSVSSMNLTADVNTVYNIYCCQLWDFGTVMAIVHVGTTMNADSVLLCTVVKVFWSCKVNHERQHNAGGREWLAAVLRWVDRSFLLIADVFMSCFFFLILCHVYSPSMPARCLWLKRLFFNHQSNIHNLH